MKYIIVVDDQDRAQAPTKPWTANLYTESGEDAEPVATGLGTTPLSAVSDALTTADSTAAARVAPPATEEWTQYVIQYQPDEDRDEWLDVADAPFADLADARTYESLDDLCPLRILERQVRETVIGNLPDRRPQRPAQ